MRLEDIPTNRLIVQIMESNAVPRNPNISTLNNPTTFINRNSSNSVNNYQSNNSYNNQQPYSSYSTQARSTAPEFEYHSQQQ